MLAASFFKALSQSWYDMDAGGFVQTLCLAERCLCCSHKSIGLEPIPTGMELNDADDSSKHLGVSQDPNRDLMTLHILFVDKAQRKFSTAGRLTLEHQ